MVSSFQKIFEPDRSALKTIAVWYGSIVGIAAILHGFFEFLQGDKKITDPFIDAIGPHQRIWEYSGLHAISYAPTYLLAGILAICMGMVLIIWSLLYLDKKGSTIILALIVIITYLVGGGYGPPLSLGTLAIIASLLSEKKIVDLSHYSNSGTGKLIIKSWPWSLILFAVVFFSSVLLNIVGWPLTVLIGIQATNDFIWFLVFLMIFLMIGSLLNALLVDWIKHS